MLICFRLTKGHAMYFRPETIVAVSSISWCYYSKCYSVIVYGIIFFFSTEHFIFSSILFSSSRILFIFISFLIIEKMLSTYLVQNLILPWSFSFISFSRFLSFISVSIPEMSYPIEIYSFCLKILLSLFIFFD